MSGGGAAAGVRPPVRAIAQGQLESFAMDAGGIEVAGWIFHPAHPIDDVRVVLDGEPIGVCAVSDRADIRDTFAEAAHGEHSGFRVHNSRGAEDRAIHKVGVIGISGGRDVIEFQDYRLGATFPRTGTPPPALMTRVAGHDDADAFLRTGLQLAGNMIDCIDRHWHGTRAPRLLDWGCGCGRMTRFVPDLVPGVELTGCDIDAEALAWLSVHMPGAAFQATAPLPPLPFADGAFDVVTACSVMTHLTWKIQRQWLAEIRRILAPGGLFVASVHGEHAASMYRTQLGFELRRGRIKDDLLDRQLDGIAPRGYYRSTFQSKDFTYEKWGRVLTVVDYLNAGLAGFQDIVVLRRDGAPKPTGRFGFRWR